jgi:hypothetical protein
MVDFISFNSGKLSQKFIVDKVVSTVLVPVSKNERMT